MTDNVVIYFHNSGLIQISEPETFALANLLLKLKPILYLNVHS